MNALCLSWGVTSLYCEEIDQKEVAIFLARKLILENKLAKPGDTIIFTAGGAKAEKIRENWIRFEEV
ncbi:MAG: pyruvate kinase, partial [Ignavibacteria bacterium]|nr:pyruvate kinase [Ignavibacteria bacterium]